MGTFENIQSLEARRLFTIPVSAGIATITGTGSADVLEIVVNSGVLQVRNASGTVLNSIAYNKVSKIIVNGGGGNDFIRIGRGDGSLAPGLRTVLSGNDGNDTIIGGPGNDQVLGGAGDDNLDGRAGQDLLDGGAGFDTANYSYRAVPVRLTLTNSGTSNDGSSTGNNSSIAQANDGGGDNLANIEAAIGGSAADNITGNASANWLDGGGGNDTIYGGAGIDTIIGGVQNDLAYGEGDNDTFLMKDGAADKFLGSPGTTYAQYDTSLDSPAPAVASQSLAASPQVKALAKTLAASAADGDLVQDKTFASDNDGLSVISADGGSIDIRDVALQSDGKIVAVGTYYPGNESDSDIIVLRLKATGELDETFGSDESGIVLTDFTPIEGDPTYDYGESVTIDSQNRIVVAGDTSYIAYYGSESQGYASDFVAARYLINGQLDPSFGDSGKVEIDPNDMPSYDYSARIVTQQVFNGTNTVEEYLIAGTVGPYNGPTYATSSQASNDSSDFAMIRLTDSGELDANFGGEQYGGNSTNGLVQEDFGVEGSTYDYLTGLNINPADGSIWLSGDSADIESDSRFAVVGYDSNGVALSYGKERYAVDGSVQSADAAIYNNLLIVIGSIGGDGTGDGAILETSIEPPISTLAPNAATGSGTFSTAIVSEDGVSSLSLSGVTVDADGTAIAVGSADGNEYVYRFNPADLTSIGNGQTFDFGEENDAGQAVVVQPDGKYIVVGELDYSAVGVIRLQQQPTDVWVDVDLPSSDIHTPGFFTYIDPVTGATKPVPTYLVWRYTKLADDGTWTIDGSDLGETYEVYQKNGIVTVTRDGEIWQETAGTVKQIVINANGGNDVVRVASDFPIPVRVNGGAGNDDIRGGNAADSLYGDEGNDILEGFGGNDIIHGGNGRDILVGGDGRDSLYGEAGEDVMIAGITKWDSSVNMQKIADEWNRTDLAYAKRVKNLINGGGKNGTITLNPQTAFSLRSVVDVLAGGSDLDAFWGSFRVPGDVITDRIASEVITSST